MAKGRGYVLGFAAMALLLLTGPKKKLGPKPVSNLAVGKPWPAPNEWAHSEKSEGQSSMQDLVRNDNPDIEFKDEEGSDEDRYMTLRMKRAADKLASLVKSEFPGLKLRVTDAFDTQGEHTGGSTHYEGRGMDFTTSDRDAAKMSRLAGLATQSGFDWVLNESTHVHASVRR